MGAARTGRGVIAAALALLSAPVPALALYENLECVPYARAVSGIAIRGDAWTWWGQAEGRYARGNAPRVGAVLAFRPHGRMRLGHVAAVSGLIDARTILVRHANWSTIGGVRGHVEDDVRVVDVSPGNDWSAVRVWYGANAALGTTRWPTWGFIYAGPSPAGAAPRFVQASAPAATATTARAPRAALFDRRLLAAIDDAARQEKAGQERAGQARAGREGAGREDRGQAAPRLSYAAIGTDRSLALPRGDGMGLSRGRQIAAR